MIEEAPNYKEVSHYHFSKLRTINITKSGENGSKYFINTIACASKFGLLFIGISNGFKVLKLENILDLDEDKENKSIEENYYSKIVSCNTPVLLALSSDHKTLAACSQINSTTVLDFYDIGAFADPEEIPEPFLSTTLSTNNSQLKDFSWNPVAEGTYAFCLSDGSLHVHDLNGINLTVGASVQNATATAICWSPKGKQLVVGKANGSFSQYKPTLQEVKNIPPPNIIEKLIVSTISWVSTAQFAVLYVPEGQNVSPYFFMVSTPKGAPAVYVNFYDVCLGNANSEDQRYFLHHESTWGTLICASTDSIEVVVLGDSPSWVQWEVKEDGRALLPARNGAKHAIGMGVMYCAQRRIVISETESYAPMPVIFFLTDNGLLVSYHLVNNAPGSVSLVRPSTPIEREGERKKDPSKNTMKVIETPRPLVTQPTTPSVNPAMPANLSFQPSSPSNVNTSQFSSSSPGSFGFGQGFQQPKLEPQRSSFGMMTSFQNVQSPIQPTIPTFGAFSSPISTNEAERFHKTSKGMVTPNPPAASPRDAAGMRQMAIAHRTTPDKIVSSNILSQTTNVMPIHTEVPTSSDMVTVSKCTEESINQQNTYLTAICEEMRSFEKEIQELKISSSQFSNIGNEEEMKKLQLFSLTFEEFPKDIMMSLNRDIQNLKNTLLESFAMVEEVKSRERRKNDSSYLSMLEDRALDPLTAKKMQSIEQHYLYLNTQLQEVSNKLDLDWYEYLERKKEKKPMRQITSTEAVYKTVVNHHKIIHNLRNTIDYLSEKIAEKKRENLSRRKSTSNYIKKSDPDDLSKLADAFLQTKIIDPDEVKPSIPKKIPPEAQNALRMYLASSKITSVRPTVVYSPAQSRLISNSLIYSGKNNINGNDLDITEKCIKMAQSPVLPTETTFTKSPSARNLSRENNVLFLNNSQVATRSDNLSLQESVGGLTFSTEKENADKSSAKLPSMDFFPLQSHSPSLAPRIDPQIYEDISPPNSPREPNLALGDSSANVFQVSFKTEPLGKEKSSSFSEAQLSSQVKTSPFFTNSSPTLLNFSKTAASSASLNFQKSSFFISPSSSGSMTISTPNVVTGKSVNEENKTMSSQLVKTTVAKSQTTLFSPLSALEAAPTSFISTPIKKETSDNTPSTVSPHSLFSTNTILATGKTSLAKDNSLGSNSIFSQKSFSSILASEAKSDPKISFSFAEPHSSPASQTSGSKSFFPTVQKEMPVFQLPSHNESKLPNVSAKSFVQSVDEIAKQNATHTTLPALESESKNDVIVVSGSHTSISDVKLTLSHTSSSEDQIAISMVYSSDTTPSNLVSIPVPSIHSVKTTESIATTLFSTPVSKYTNSPATSVTTLSLSNLPSQSTSTSVTEQSQNSPLNKTPSSLPSVAATDMSEATSVNVICNVSLPEKTNLETQKPLQVSISTAPNSQSLLFEQQLSSSILQQQSVSETQVSTTVSKSEATSVSQPLPAETSAISLPQPLSAVAVATTVSQPSHVVEAVKTTTSEFFSNTPNVLSVASQQPQISKAIETTKSSVFSNVTTASQKPPDTTSTLFSGTPTTTTSIFKSTFQSSSTTSAFSNPENTTSAPAFGQSAFFGQTMNKQSTFFQKPPDAPLFAAQSSTFGTVTNSSTGPFQQTGSFFTQQGNNKTSVFGGNVTNTSGNSVFGSNPENTSGNTSFGTQAASSFSFGKSTFGQTQGTFGLAKSVFGQQNTASAFGQPASPPSNSFGSSSGSNPFGQGSFFSGLGGKPSAENASKNMFATLGKTSAETSSFGNTSFGATSFGAKTSGSFSGGSFSSGGGSVSQSGFGAFQQTPQKTSGFGANPSFGGAPAFGSPPAFGGTPSFGGGSPLASVFGSQQQTQNANFSSFASASSPTFGSIATQNQSGFGSQPQQQTTFGQQPNAFGAAPAFGGQSTFGSPSGTSNTTSAFTQWRN